MTPRKPGRPRRKAEGFRDSAAHILGELERIDLLLRRQVARHRRGAGGPGATLSDAEVEAWLESPLGSGDEAPDDEAFAAAIAALSKRIAAAKASAGRRPEVVLRLDRLVEAFDLDGVDRDILLIALAPEISRRYGCIYALLQDDPTAVRPRVDLAFAMLTPGPAAMFEARRRLAPEAPLCRNRLLALGVEAGALRLLPERSLAVEGGILDYLTGLDGLDPGIREWVISTHPKCAPGDLHLSRATSQRFDALTRAGPPRGGLVVNVCGPRGSGRTSAAEALASAWALPLLVVDGSRAARLPEAEFAAGLAIIRREAILRRAAICWEDIDPLLAEGRADAFASMLGMATDGVGLIVCTGERAWGPRGGARSAPTVALPLSCPDPGQRLILWKQALSGTHGTLIQADLEDIAERFRFTGGRIQDAAAAAIGDARLTSGDAPPTSAQLRAACRRVSSVSLGTLGTRIEPRRGWDDLVLPPGHVQQLRSVADSIVYRSHVHERWGFGEKLSLGKGYIALFTGPSGTGKTLAAEVLAHALDLDLYRIDLSAVVNKYIGETEKNLSRVFDEAEAGEIVLLFDEADAIFGKRSAVVDAHDRYANIETSFLLQRIEAYDGLVILTTNLRRNMDEAFTRRIQTTIDFPMPTRHERASLWSTIWPSAVPLAEDIDPDMLSRLEISGGAIKNAALGAAYLAAAEGQSVKISHVVRAVKSEFSKMGGIVDIDLSITQ